MYIISWSWSWGLSRSPLSGKYKMKPNKIKQELTQHDAGFLVLLLENNCKYFMPLQVKVNVFSVLRTMKNTLGMYYSPRVGLRVFRSQKEFLPANNITLKSNEIISLKPSLWHKLISQLLLKIKQTNVLFGQLVTQFIYH